MNSRESLTIIALVLVAVVSAIGLFCYAMHTMQGPRISNSVVGKWEFNDQYGRTVTWLVSGDGTIKRFASDDPTDVDDYQWWRRNDSLILRPPISTTDHVYHTASFAIDGRKFDDQRERFRISKSNAGSMTLVNDSGQDIILTKQGHAR